MFCRIVANNAPDILQVIGISANGTRRIPQLFGVPPDKLAHCKRDALESSISVKQTGSKIEISRPLRSKFPVDIDVPSSMPLSPLETVFHSRPSRDPLWPRSGRLVCRSPSHLRQCLLRIFRIHENVGGSNAIQPQLKPDTSAPYSSNPSRSHPITPRPGGYRV
jgi:hypothetical protein